MLASVRSLEHLPMSTAPWHTHIPHHTTRTARCPLTRRPEEKKLVLGRFSTPPDLLQTAVIKRSGQSNLRQNRKDEMLHGRMMREWHEGYLQASPP